MKLAGSNRGSKLSMQTYEVLTRGRLSQEDQIAANHASLAVTVQPEDDFDDGDVFALTRGIDSHVSAEHQAALDAVLQTAGLRNLLHAVALLLESRVDEEFLQDGHLIYHLARENAFARAAERLHGLAVHPDIGDVSK